MDPMEALDKATKQYGDTKDAFDEARTEAVMAVVDALRAGKKPTEVTKRSPFTAAYVRRIARDNGIEGDPRYVREVKQS
jgi:hypothetical protein